VEIGCSHLEDGEGNALLGEHSVTVKFYDAEEAQDDVCSANNALNPSLVAGRFQVKLPVSCTEAVKGSPDIWVEVEVDGGPLGRTKLGAVPYALEAVHASQADVASGAAGELATTLESKVTQGGTAKLSCPTDMAALGNACVDLVRSASANNKNAQLACHAAGKRVCTADEMYLCDVVGSAAGGCGPDTDDGAITLWTSTLAGAADILYTYAGTNALTAENQTTLHPYYCCASAGIALQ
jgi:hypothetical protein